MRHISGVWHIPRSNIYISLSSLITVKTLTSTDMQVDRMMWLYLKVIEAICKWMRMTNESMHRNGYPILYKLGMPGDRSRWYKEPVCLYCTMHTNLVMHACIFVIFYDVNCFLSLFVQLLWRLLWACLKILFLMCNTYMFTSSQE